MSENNFRKIAIQTAALSPLMMGRNPIKTEDVIAKYPNGFTVNAFDFATMEQLDKKTGEMVEKTFPVLTIVEDNSVYISGGHILNKICQEWANAYSGDIEAASDSLAECGGVRMSMEMGLTKDKNEITKIIIL